MPCRPVWSPILQGVTWDRAREIVDQAVTDLGQLDRIGEEFHLDASLAGGWAGMALFWAYINRVSFAPVEEGTSALSECLSRSRNALRGVETPVGFFAGSAGLGWVARHLLGFNCVAPPELEDLERECRKRVIAAIEEDALGDDYDLVNGWVGLGVYLFDCLPDREVRGALSLLVRRIADRVEPGTGSWWTPPDLLAPSHLPLTPAGQFNLGVAHGIPAVLWLLARAFALGIDEERCSQLLARSVPWLLEQRREADAGSVFPAFVAPDFEPRWCRSAWCYGDPGIASVLYYAARNVGGNSWQEKALAIARSAARRPRKVSGVADACLCHGAAGLAHLFNRLFQESGDPLFRDAALGWFNDVMDRQVPGTGVAGFSAAYVDADGNRHEEACPGLLEGTAGIALALLAGFSEIPPGWDRMFLLSGRGA